MDISLGTCRARLVQIAVLCLVNAAAAGTSFAADYASQDYGHTNTADAQHTPTAPYPSSARAPQASAPRARLDLPNRGETMARVRARYGAPRSMRGPVGHPPITRWNYDGYHVYFEGNRVIHTVMPNDPEPLHDVDQRQAVQP